MEPIERVVRSLGDEDLPAKLAGVAGADLTTLLLEVFKLRAGAATPATVMRQRREDRFVAPSRIDLRALRRAETLLLRALPEGFHTVVLSPLTPLGLHSAVAAVDQHRLVSTIRRTDVAADPTAGLAVEAAVRRGALLADDPKSVERIHLASLQRVVRAQMFEGPRSFAHFTLLGLVTAGRDTGSHEFEVEAMAHHAAIVSKCLLAAGADDVIVSVTDWTRRALDPVAGMLRRAVADHPVTVIEDPARARARGYYLQGGFEVAARYGGEIFDLADGGLANWTQGLLASRKERLMISGIGVDRVAMALTEANQR